MWTDKDTEAIVKELKKVLDTKKLYTELKKELRSKEVFDNIDSKEIIMYFQFIGHDMDDIEREIDQEELKE